MHELNDEDFERKLREHLEKFSGPDVAAVPVFYNEDGSINRPRTLELGCYASLKLKA